MLLDVTGSPVNVDSFTDRERASASSPSAGISSPVSSKTRSPQTISLFGISVITPSLITFTGVSSLTLLRMSNFLLASISNQNPTPVARNIAKKIPMVSMKSRCINEIPSERKAAIRRILIIGSSNLCRKSLHNGSFSGGVKTFFPCLSLLSATSAEVSPV